MVVLRRTPLAAVIQKDCLKYLRGTDQQFDFIFADPPFNIGVGYSDDKTGDKRTDPEYAEWSRLWFDACTKHLINNGIFCVHCPDEHVRTFLNSALHCNLDLLSWIIWHYRFGQCNRGNWIGSKAHCLVFVRYSSDYVWNPDAVLVDSDRAIVYDDPRTRETATPGKRLPFDVWGIPSDGSFWGRVQGNNTERRAGHPNQLPERYLERLLRAYTNPDSLCYDPFGGSGTTLVVAKALHRPCITTEISPTYCRSICERWRKGAVHVTE